MYLLAEICFRATVFTLIVYIDNYWFDTLSGQVAYLVVHCNSKSATTSKYFFSIWHNYVPWLLTHAIEDKTHTLNHVSNLNIYIGHISSVWLQIYRFFVRIPLSAKMFYYAFFASYAAYACLEALLSPLNQMKHDIHPRYIDIKIFLNKMAAE